MPFVEHFALPRSLHVPRGSAFPATIGVHVPSDATSEQLRQAPVHAVSQQTPSTQKLLAQSAFARHALPGAILPHDLLTHAWPGSQSASMRHPLLQTPPAQRLGLQLATPGGLQVPRPSQTPGRLRRTRPVHVGARHCVSAAYRSQPSKSSHVPVVPQLVAPMSLHIARGSGAPSSTGQQVPTRPGAAHETQPPSQVTLQQTESAQKPDAHSVPAAHFAPFIFLPQLWLSHWCPVTHWSF